MRVEFVTGSWKKLQEASLTFSMKNKNRIDCFNDLGY